MKVLLTGASGFVGSHVLDHLRARNIPVTLLLRPESSRALIQPHADAVEIRPGSVTDPRSLEKATEGITHVIHCAGATKAADARGFLAVNRDGVHNLLRALTPTVQRFVHISSLAAFGPATPQAPAREDQTPSPVSTYGRSKLEGELQVREHCTTDWVILRPPAVYGPRDTELLRLFKSVAAHLKPQPSNQALSLVLVTDLAKAAVACLDHPTAVRKTYFVACKEIMTARQFAQAIAEQAGTWSIPLPLPTPALWPVCFIQELISRVTGKPNVLSLQKYAELKAPGWVCDPGLFEREIGPLCSTGIKEGIDKTWRWYREHRWL